MIAQQQATRLNRVVWIGLIALGSWIVSACQENLPTSQEEGFLPVEATTVEIRLPFHEFARDMRVLGGYGLPSELGIAFLAHDFQGTLDVRTLIRFAPYPEAITVRDTTGTTRPDSSLTFVGGKVVALVDTLDSDYEGPVTVGGGFVREEWSPRTATWDLAVDSVGLVRAWEEPGGGEALDLGTAIWDPAETDSVVLEVDSAVVARWGDTTDASRGLRLQTVTEGVRLKILTLGLVLTARPASNPDTLVEASVNAREGTFVYHPAPEAPDSDLRVGGVPAWRSVFEMELPETLDGPDDVCQKVSCPLTLRPEMVNGASLILRTARTPPAFMPADSLRIDVRTVLEPSLLPKSPLGPPVTSFQGVRVPPSHFGEAAGSGLNIPITGYVRNLIRGENTAGHPVSNTVAILSAFEPTSLHFATFQGPDGDHPPELRLILTLGEGVQIR